MPRVEGSNPGLSYSFICERTFSKLEWRNAKSGTGGPSCEKKGGSGESKKKDRHAFQELIREVVRFVSKTIKWLTPSKDWYGVKIKTCCQSSLVVHKSIHMKNEIWTIINKIKMKGSNIKKNTLNKLIFFYQNLTNSFEFFCWWRYTCFWCFCCCHCRCSIKIAMAFSCNFESKVLSCDNAFSCWCKVGIFLKINR